MKKRFFVFSILLLILASAAAVTLYLLRPYHSPWGEMPDYPAPPPVSRQALAEFPRDGKPHNIIFIVGDGMGAKAIEVASRYAHGEAGQLVMEQLPVQTWMTTYSADSKVTDSAASGTALAGGYKTNNKWIGIDPSGVSRKSVGRLAADSGRAVGLITTDPLTGATVAAFGAHINDRDSDLKIAVDLAESGYQVMFGATRKLFRPVEIGGARTDGRNLLAELAAKGYQEAASPAAFARKGIPVIGFSEAWREELLLLRDYSRIALDLLAAHEKGFLIVIESSFPDYGGHRKRVERTVFGTLMVDHVVESALKFAQERGNTLVVVTADHETGGISLRPTSDPKRPDVFYATKRHTGKSVRLFAFGPGSELFAVPLDNTDVAKNFARLWDLKLELP